MSVVDDQFQIREPPASKNDFITNIKKQLSKFSSYIKDGLKILTQTIYQITLVLHFLMDIILSQYAIRCVSSNHM